MTAQIKLLILTAALLGSVKVFAMEAATDANPKLGRQLITLDGTNWEMAIDRKEAGLQEKWWTGPVSNAIPALVPWLIGDTPSVVDWHGGVAWYWHELVVPANPHRHGRFLLRFWGVSYKADVWVNDVPVGGHEGADGVFVLDVTQAIKENSTNRLAIRIVVPTEEGTDGIRRSVVPGGNVFRERGGITDSVELEVTPAIWMEDMFVHPDPNTGIINVQVTVHNSGKTVNARLSFVVNSASGDGSIVALDFERRLLAGDTVLNAQLKVAQPRLWEPNDPNLYRVTSTVAADGSMSFDERSAECGFRDFRVENGYFRLNGKRLFLRGSHTGDDCPIGGQMPYKDENWLRRDLINMKAMGFNMIRFFQHAPQRYELDLCDEIGLLVYEEPRGGWLYENSPKMEERFDRSLTELIQRDRNHACIVMWGLLNETPTPGVPHNNMLFPIITKKLSLVRALDDSRLVMLSSGRWDCKLSVGSVANPGSEEWQCLLGKEGPGQVGTPPDVDFPPSNRWLLAYTGGSGDVHIYPRVPHSSATIDFMRTAGQGGKGIFVSEYGIGSAVDLERTTRNFEQRGMNFTPSAKIYRERLDKFMTECWEPWSMADIFGRPEDYFQICVGKMERLRLMGMNIIRSNPNVIGYSMTGTVDQGMTGEGVSASTFRELKPGVVDSVSDGWAPLRWCLFAQPFNVYRGSSVKLEAVIANEDVLVPGDYPVRLEVFGPDQNLVFHKKTSLTIADPQSKPEPRFALPVFSNNITASWPPGRYRFIATFENGAAAAGKAAEFVITDRTQMPPVETDVALWGDDLELEKWLSANAIKSHPITSASTKREVILVSNKPESPGNFGAFSKLAERIARGSTAIFLSPEVFAKGNQALGWLPLENKGKLQTSWDWAYLTDEWARKHPIFDGLPCGGLMDYDFYCNIIPDKLYYGQDKPEVAVSGGAEVSFSYSSGLMVAIYPFGNGHFILNTLNIRENLNNDPAADRLLRNMLRYASKGNNKDLAPLPDDFNLRLKSIGYLP